MRREANRTGKPAKLVVVRNKAHHFPPYHIETARTPVRVVSVLRALWILRPGRPFFPAGFSSRQTLLLCRLCLRAARSDFRAAPRRAVTGETCPRCLIAEPKSFPHCRRDSAAPPRRGRPLRARRPARFF